MAELGIILSTILIAIFILIFPYLLTLIGSGVEIVSEITDFTWRNLWEYYSWGFKKFGRSIKYAVDNFRGR